MLFPLDDLAASESDADLQAAHQEQVQQIATGRGAQAWCARCSVAGPSMRWVWAHSSGDPGRRESGVVGVCPRCGRPVFFHLVRRF